MNGLKAEERLQEGSVGSAEELARLILAATGDKKAADDALSRAEEDRLSRVRRE